MAYDRGDYLKFSVSGDWTEDSACILIDAIKHECEKRKARKLLLDLKEYILCESEMTRYFSGVRLAEAFLSPYRIAAFTRAGAINRFAETVARNRGVDIMVFPDEPQALAWLLTE